MYIQRLTENLVQKEFFVLEIFDFKVDAYMYVQKTLFCAVADLTYGVFAMVKLES
jgi:hypothetical protein